MERGRAYLEGRGFDSARSGHGVGVGREERIRRDSRIVGPGAGHRRIGRVEIERLRGGIHSLVWP
jgi:hypothetical protein